MTTVLADARFGVMVSDSNCADEDRVWLRQRKVFRVKGALVGVAGSVASWRAGLEWLRKGGERPDLGDASMLVLSASGLVVYTPHEPAGERISGGIEAIGTGAKAAMCTYEALGWTDPKQAVRIVCKHDANSRGPVRVYHL
jgi:hypothetical protein